MIPRPIAGAAGPATARYDADIIILSLDRVEHTLAAIESARCQIGAAWHLFVLDQGSQTSAVAQLAAAVAGDQHVTLLAAGTNLGVAGGRNALSALGLGRVIIGLDNDAVFGSERTVAHLVRALDAEPGLAAIGCRIVTHDTGSDDLSSWGYPLDLMPCAADSFDTVTFVGAGHAIRRSAWEQAGGYDAKLFFCWEEFDFCLRAIALGWRVRYRGDIVVRHRVAAEQRVRWSDARWQYFVRNRLYIERKLGRSWLSLAPRAAAYLLKGLRHGRSLATLGAILAAREMAPRAGRAAMPDPAAAYLRRNDRAHRGSLPHRVRREVLGPIGAGATADR